MRADEKLIPRAEDALSWLNREREQFNFAEFAQDEFEKVKLYKPLSELVLTATLLARDTVLRDGCLALMDWAWCTALREGQYILDLTSARPELVELVGIYARLRQFGFRNRALDLWIGYLAGSDLMHGLELPAWRQTALRSALALLGLGPFPRESVAGSWVGARPEPWTFTDTTGYPMTHEIFYLTDFGRHHTRVPEPTRQYVGFWLPAWWRCSTAANNNDLAAELIMTAACIRAPAPPGAQRALIARQLHDGSVQGPPGAGQDLIKPGLADARRQFLANYHTTLVTLLALTTDRWACAA